MFLAADLGVRFSERLCLQRSLGAAPGATLWPLQSIRSCKAQWFCWASYSPTAFGLLMPLVVHILRHFYGTEVPQTLLVLKYDNYFVRPSLLSRNKIHSVYQHT